ncbi:DotD/TraH family lipoprotein [Cysteiniphilum marinum]|uniref:DotD/TraH family lipoprotein n=1 Tax=Cysteiniphilum marinum TaxID=2774191 RepID=UPI00193B024C|nr:DotD/TraH family lipoprotein [Cysteiniphilum marinum]
MLNHHIHNIFNQIKTRASLFSVFIVVAFALLTSACAHVDNKPNPSHDPLYALDMVAVETSKNLNELALIQNAKLKDSSSEEEWRDFMFNLQAVPKALSKRKSFQYVGTVQDSIKGIADLAGFDFYVVGNPPSSPVMVSIKSDNDMLIDTLRDINAQTGSKADISILPDSKLITLTFNQYDVVNKQRS